jgi:hypothetical protein
LSQRERETREYERGGVCVVGEFVLAYLDHFTVFLCFWQDVITLGLIRTAIMLKLSKEWQKIYLAPAYQPSLTTPPLIR